MKMKFGMPAAWLALSIAVPLGAANGQEIEPADARGPRMGMAMARGLPALEEALRRQEELGLSAAQRSELAAVKTRLDEQNTPLLEQMRAAMGEVREERGVLRDSVRAERGAMRDSVRADRRGAVPQDGAAGPDGARPMDGRRAGGGASGARPPLGMDGTVQAELAPVMEQLRLNQAAALQEVTRILTTEQLAQLRTAERGQRMERRGMGAQGAGRGAQAPGAAQ